MNPCRWLGGQLGGGRYACRSAKIVARNGTTLAFCSSRCWYRDHEPTGGESPSDTGGRIELPVLPCDYRGAMLERCHTCGGAGDVYSCELFDVGVILRPHAKAKPGTQNCQECGSRSAATS